MRLTIDLRFAAEPGGGDGERHLTLDDLVPVVRRPAGLFDLLWRRRAERVRIVVDGLPPSGVQAGALFLLALARTRRLELDGPEGLRAVSRPALAARAAATLAVALPRELWSSVRTVRRARRFLARRISLPRRIAGPASVTYLRPAPTLRYLGQYVGGAAAHTTGVINGFQRSGLDVEVYAPERPARVQGVSFVPVPLRRVHHLAQWLTVTAYSQQVVSAAERRAADFVYQRYVLGSYAGLELASRREVPLVLEFNGSEVWSIRHWGSGRLPLVRTLTEIEERNVRDASLVVVVSDVLKEELVAGGIDPGRVLVNPNGVDVDALAPLRELQPAGWRERLGRPEAPTVGFVGTFGLWHGVKLLPAMARAVAQQVPEARWILIGDGRLHAEVRREIESLGLESRVELTGVVPHERALELLAASDVCVSPHVPNPDGTRFFGSPTKLFEYMGLGKAIVASDLEQIGEVLEHERTALVCRPGDVEESAAAVVRLLGDPGLRARLGGAALEEAALSYSWDAHVRRILQALAGGVPQPAAAAG